MRALLALTALLLLGVLGYAIYENASPALGQSDKNEAGTAQDKAASEAVPIQPASDLKLADSSEPLLDKVYSADVRASWAKFRPAVERLVPDPDGIGACPPAYLHARSSLVVRRYIRPINGFHIWQHEDGSETWLHYSRSKDPKTGETLTTPVISTVVPTKVHPRADEAKAP